MDWFVNIGFAAKYSFIPNIQVCMSSPYYLGMMLMDLQHLVYIFLFGCLAGATIEDGQDAINNIEIIDQLVKVYKLVQWLLLTIQPANRHFISGVLLDTAVSTAIKVIDFGFRASSTILAQFNTIELSVTILYPSLSVVLPYFQPIHLDNLPHRDERQCLRQFLELHLYL